MNTTPTLSAPGIVLRPLTIDDAPALFIALADAETQKFRRAEKHQNLAETRAYTRDTLSRSRAAWAISEDGGEALGRLALRVLEQGVGEFGIVLRRAAQGRGLGAKAISLAASYAFDDLRLLRLTADIDAENAASLALFRSAGFTQETFLPGHRTTKLGLRDSLILAKSRPKA